MDFISIYVFQMFVFETENHNPGTFLSGIIY